MFRICFAGTEADRRNQARHVRWALIWSLTYVGASLLFELKLPFSAPVKWAIAMTPLVVAIFPLRAYLRFLREADELVRRIQYEGIAFGFTSGMIFGIGYPLLEKAGAPTVPPEVAFAVMMLGLSIGVWRAVNRYR